MKPVVIAENISKLYSFSSTRREFFFRVPRTRPARPREGDLDLQEPGPYKDTFWALKDVSLELAPGECLGIVGRNGSGKSTLLKILSRIIRPTEGAATVNGRLHPLLEIGTGFHPDLSGRRNIYLNALLLGLRREEIRERTDEIIAFSGIGKFVDTPVKFYSAGMYVRLAFSVGIHVNPAVMVVDEIITVGDAAFQAKCVEKILELKRAGCAILMAAHDLDRIRQFSDRAIWLKAGKIRFSGTADETCRRYLEDYQP